MGLVIRFGYCPPNPGPKAKIRNKWYREDEIEDDEFCIDTVLVCEKIVAIDTDIDKDYKIWRNS